MTCKKVTMIKVRPETHKYLKIYMAESGRRSFDELFSRELIPMLKNKKRRWDAESGW